jgi:hypothetical protein
LAQCLRGRGDVIRMNAVCIECTIKAVNFGAECNFRACFDYCIYICVLQYQDGITEELYC